MTIRRGSASSDKVTILRRALAQDEQLSFRALGIATYVLSKPPNWTTDAVQLSRGEGREGEKAVRTALRELETRGYLRRRRRQVTSGGEQVGKKRVRGGSWVTDWDLTDDPASLVDTDTTERQERPLGQPPAGPPPPPARTARAGTAGPPPGKRLERETGKRDAPPTAPVVDLRAAELQEGVGGAIQGRAPKPSAKTLQRECHRLAELGWTREVLEHQAREHDWTGARAGAVIAWLRDLDGPPPAVRIPAARPAHCGTCDPGTRLLLDDNGRPRRGHPCPTCGGKP